MTVMNLADIVILAGARTAIGSFGGSLAALSPAQLGTAVAKEAISRSGVVPTDVDHAVFGHIITTSAEDAYLARHIALSSGMAATSVAFNVNRLCGSAVQSVISAAQLIQLGQSTIALAGGAESMSNGAYLLPNARRGLRMGHAGITDLTLAILTDPFGSGHMGITAETIAAQYGFSRTDLDTFAAQSHQRASVRDPLQVGMQCDHESLTLFVNDAGGGIDAELLPKIGQQLFQANGQGMGLFLLTNLLEREGGKLSLRNLNPGVCASLSLPVLSQ